MSRAALFGIGIGLGLLSCVSSANGAPAAPNSDDAVIATPIEGKGITVPSPPPSAEQRLAWLRTQLDGLVGDPGLTGSKVGVAVCEADTGKILYGRNEGTPLNPASNVKLFTTAAALALLGPEYRWKTVAYADAPIQSGEIKGRLFLKGHGDPTLVVEDLWRIVADLWSAGVRRVNGDVVIDSSFFDAVKLSNGFNQKEEDAAYRAPNGAVSLNYNAVSVRIVPGAGDAAAGKLVIEPPSPYFEITNEVRTTATGRTNVTLEAKDGKDRTQLIARGRIRVGDPGVVLLRRVGHPELYAGFALRELLVRRGIKVAGQVLVGNVPPDARALTVHYSLPLGVAIRDVNKRSNNFMAEQLLKTLGAEKGGRPGTWQKGLDAVAVYLDTIGIPRADYKMTNGSGLYDSNRFSPQQLVTLLRATYRDFRFSSDYLGSLALAGADGTIGHRMAGGLAERFVRAKTGTLAGVSCLSGYAGAPGKSPLIFSVLMNELGEAASARARRVQDQIAETLVTYLQR